MVEASGTLDPATYEYGTGSTTVISRLIIDYDRLDLQTSEGHAGLQGLWLQLSDDLAVPIESYHDRGLRWWYLGSHSVGWSAGDEVEVSLWDRDPIPPAQQLLTATLTAQAINDEHTDGSGYAEGVAGSLEPSEFEYEPGKTTRITRLAMNDPLGGVPDFQVGAEDPEALEGLWLTERPRGSGSPDVGMLLESKDSRTGLFEAGGIDCTYPWADGEVVEVSLWDRNPVRPQQHVPETSEQVGRESAEQVGPEPSESGGEPRRIPDDGDRVPHC